MLETPTPPQEASDEKPKGVDSTSSPQEGVLEVERTSEKLPGVSVDFLYVTHLPELAPQIAQKVKDAYLILLEDTGGTKEERALLQSLLNNISAKGFGSSPKEAEVLSSLSQGDEFDLRLAAALAGSGKEIQIIDIPSDDPAYYEVVEIENSGAGINEFMMEGEADKALTVFPSFIDSIVQADRLREEYFLEELSTLIPELQTDGVRKVAVIQGAAHTSVHHRFARNFPDIPSKLRFEESPIHRYDPVATLIRRKTLFPQKEISEADYARALIGDAIFASAAGRILGDLRAGRDLALDLSQKLTPEELKEVLDQFSSRQKDDLAEGGDRQRAFIKNTSLIALDWAQRKGVPIPE